MNDFLRNLLYLPEQASSYAVKVDTLHYFVIIVTMLGAIAVGTTALFFFWRYRIRVKNQTTEDVKAPVWLEVVFVAGPLALFLVWFAIGFRDYIEMTSPPKNTMDIYVEGKQWMWKFAYPDGPNAVNTLRVPAGRPVRLMMTSRDVIHSMFIPAFRAKKDVLPGRYSYVWFEAILPGKYPLYCTEMCGLNHSTMIGEVIVMSPQEFDGWMENERKGLAPKQDGRPVEIEHQSVSANLIEQGQKVAVSQGCFKCHTADGDSHIGPTWLDLYGREQKFWDGTSAVVDEAYLTASMMDPGAKIVAGYPNVMPTYRGRLAGPEAAALVEYIKSLRSDRLQNARNDRAIYAPIPTE